jgi:mono/diheme cytochrome c family protein
MRGKLSGMLTGASLRALTTAAVITAAVPALALAHGSSTPSKPPGSPAAGKPLFVSTCGLCHKLKEAKTAGTIGPDLDKVHLTQPAILKAITYGGSSVMTKAQIAKYPTRMVSYKNVLSKKQIEDIAAYVYKATHPTTPPAS